MAFLLAGVVVVAHFHEAGIMARPPTRPGPTMTVQDPSSLQISVVTSDSDIARAAAFFAESFWSTDLTEEQLAEVGAAHAADFDARYALTVGRRRFQTALLIAQDGDNICGCAGLEMAVVDPLSKDIWSRVHSEAYVSDCLSALGGRKRGEYRKASLTDLAAEFLPGKLVVPVMSNLSVDRSCRGQGLGRRLVSACEDVARKGDGWCGGSFWLLVEEGNTVARAFYTTLGFEEVWQSNGAPATRVVARDDGGVEVCTTAASLIAMAREL